LNYIQFLVPGIIGMSIIFSSTFAGMSVLWDREFGFLKEIMVAPVSRISVVLGRIAGGATTAMIQGALILGISIIIGFKILKYPFTSVSCHFYAFGCRDIHRPGADYCFEDERYAGIWNYHKFCHISPFSFCQAPCIRSKISQPRSDIFLTSIL